jgi:hypothetical protein
MKTSLPERVQSPYLLVVYIGLCATIFLHYILIFLKPDMSSKTKLQIPQQSDVAPLRVNRVHHFHVPLEAGILHIFISGITMNETLWVKGFIFHELPRAEGKMDQRVPVEDSPLPYLSIGIATSKTNTTWIKPNSVWPRRYRSFEVQLQNTHGKYMIFNVSNRVISLEAVSIDARSWKPVGKQIRQILSSMYGPAEDPKILSRLLQQQIDYHSGLGIVGTTLYCRPDQCNRYSLDPGIGRLISTGQLLLVEWSMPYIVDWVYFHQSLQYNHAILQYYRTGTRLFIADIDEFLALKKPNLISNLHCLNLSKECITIPVFVVHPMSPVDDEYSISSLQLWEENSISGKSIVNPDNVFNFYVHEGSSCQYVNKSCLRIAHFYSMFRHGDNRSVIDQRLLNDSSWLWPIRNNLEENPVHN